MDIRKMNLVNQRTKIEPNYSLAQRKTYIELALNDQGDLFLFGVVDNNYIHWASRTKISDLKTNEAIFNHIANQPFEFVTNQSLALRSIGFPYEELKRWYPAALTRAQEIGYEWRTPFGHFYGQKQIDHNGLYFARDISGFLDVLLERCRFREASGCYEAALDYSLNILSEHRGDPCYYQRVKELIAMIEKEDFLVLSPTASIREKYLLFQEKASTLYQQYMTSIR